MSSHPINVNAYAPKRDLAEKQISTSHSQRAQHACSCRHGRAWPFGSPSGVAVATAVAGVAVIGAALAEKYHSNPWLMSWIPAACCVTNDCCWEIQESELRPLPDDQWEVLSTGQVRRRTDWSPDGKFYRCACDYTGTTWVRHQGANTRCLFIPMRSAVR